MVYEWDVDAVYSGDVGKSMLHGRSCSQAIVTWHHRYAQDCWNDSNINRQCNAACFCKADRQQSACLETIANAQTPQHLHPIHAPQEEAICLHVLLHVGNDHVPHLNLQAED